MNRLLLILGFMISLSSLFAKESDPKKAMNPNLWDRPVIIGASVSDGYQHEERMGGKRSDALALDLFLKKRLKNTETKITNLSHRFCFFSPILISHKQLFDAQKQTPSIVIAVDQLFWHIYGIFPSEEDRLKAFRNALEKLTPITCPLIIGNIPDASESIRKMLSVRQVPQLDTISKANSILTAWTEKRMLNKQQTAIVDLANFMKLCVADEEIQLNNITYPAGTTKAFLQTDMLHPTSPGVSAISHAVMDAVTSLNIKP